MKTINGNQYSRKSFPEYKTRVKIDITDVFDVHHSLDLYTTNYFGGGNKDHFKTNIISDLMSGATKNVREIKIIHIATREQDDATTKMLFEFFELDEENIELGSEELSVEELVKRIDKKNLSLLDKEDRNCQYELRRLYAWQEDYNYIPWDEFKHYIYCDDCKGYDKEQCICYAR